MSKAPVFALLVLAACSKARPAPPPPVPVVAPVVAPMPVVCAPGSVVGPPELPVPMTSVPTRLTHCGWLSRAGISRTSTSVLGDILRIRGLRGAPSSDPAPTNASSPHTPMNDRIFLSRDHDQHRFAMEAHNMMARDPGALPRCSSDGRHAVLQPTREAIELYAETMMPRGEGVPLNVSPLASPDSRLRIFVIEPSVIAPTHSDGLEIAFVLGAVIATEDGALFSLVFTMDAETAVEAGAECVDLAKQMIGTVERGSATTTLQAITYALPGGMQIDVPAGFGIRFMRTPDSAHAAFIKQVVLGNDPSSLSIEVDRYAGELRGGDEVLQAQLFGAPVTLRGARERLARFTGRFSRPGISRPDLIIGVRAPKDDNAIAELTRILATLEPSAP